MSRYGCDAGVIELADGPAEQDTETEIDILELVEQNQVGGAGKFNAATFCDELIANFERDQAVQFPAPITLGVGHPVASAPAAGRILGLRKEGTRLKARVVINGDFVPLIKKRIYCHVSPEFRIPYTNSKGERTGAKLIALAITNLPFQRGADGKPVGTFQLAELPHDADDGSTEPRSNPLPVSAGQESEMDTTEIKALIASETSGLTAQLTETASKATKAHDEAAAVTAQLSEANKQIATLAGQIETLTKQRPASAAELAERDATIAQLTEENGALKRGVRASAIRQAIELAEGAGKLTAPMRDKWFPGYAEDPNKAFDGGTHPFRDPAGFITWLADAPVISPVGSRLGGTPSRADGDGSDSYEARSKRTGVSVDELKAHDEAMAARARR